MTLLGELIERKVFAPLIEEWVLISEARRRPKLGKESKFRRFENRNEKLASVKIQNAKSFTVSVFWITKIVVDNANVWIVRIKTVLINFYFITFNVKIFAGL